MSFDAYGKLYLWFYFMSEREQPYHCTKSATHFWNLLHKYPHSVWFNFCRTSINFLKLYSPLKSTPMFSEWVSKLYSWMLASLTIDLGTGPAILSFKFYFIVYSCHCVFIVTDVFLCNLFITFTFVKTQMGWCIYIVKMSMLKNCQYLGIKIIISWRHILTLWVWLLWLH